MPGTLFVVSTPIGNLDDLSPRARQVLAESGLVACEDTRHTGRLLARFNIKARMLSLNEQNEGRRLPGLLDRLAGGEDLALVSDAGTPLMSDPGFLLVRAAADHGVPVVAVPGPSAILAALAVSGLPPYPFTFAGFAPRKQGKRRKFFEWIAQLDHTVVVFESPHRLLASLESAVEVLGARPASLSRELTKMHEETLRGALPELAAEMARRPSLKGEFVLVVGASSERD